MENLDYETTRQLKTDLNDALRNLKGIRLFQRQEWNWTTWETVPSAA